METHVMTAATISRNLNTIFDQVKEGQTFLIPEGGKEIAKLSPKEPQITPAATDWKTLFTETDNICQGTLLNPPGFDRITIRELLDEGRK
ncbi:MAG: hypothetical protein ACO1QB_03935 [Verrucomicrobiales bacterium]